MDWRAPNPPGANPLVAERAPWRSSQSCVTGGRQPIGNPYRFLSFLLRTLQPCATPIVTRGEGSFSYQGVSTRGVGTGFPRQLEGLGHFGGQKIAAIFGPHLVQILLFLHSFFCTTALCAGSAGFGRLFSDQGGEGMDTKLRFISFGSPELTSLS